ncbi:MAG: arginine decarboxylase, partial [Solirubrobacteraceae bacterium]|nr:arginine decarboxylase [Solirubrobacteraceae bacterium]
MSAAEQPNAPYLDALVAYGFRGSTRFHVPGHKGGRGADSGLLNAIGLMALQLDIPQ